jgi:hypothetical protein
LSVQIKTLQEAGYLEVNKTGLGRLSHTVCRITSLGHQALRAYEQGLRRMFAEGVPDEEGNQKKQNQK